MKQEPTHSNDEAAVNPGTRAGTDNAHSTGAADDAATPIDPPHTDAPTQAADTEDATGPADTPTAAAAAADTGADVDGDAGTNADAEASAAGEDKEPEWWDQLGMPWNKKPTKADLWCFGSFVAVGLISFALLPLRAWLLGSETRIPWAVAILGSSTGGAALGSLASVGVSVPLLWPLLLGGLTRIKFDWVYWWAGQLWGRGIIEMSAARSERAARNYARAERWAKKMGWIGIFAAYIPIPLPLRLVVFVLAGAHGMPLKKFMIIDYIAATVWLAAYMAFGYAVGEPAVAVLEAYAKVANYIAIGLVVVIIVGAMLRGNKTTPKRTA